MRVFRGLVPALDLALGLRVARCAADVAHLVGFNVFRQFASDVAGTIITEQPGLVQHRGAVTARGLEPKVQRVGHVLGAYVGTQLPGDDVAREVIEHGRQVHPAPADALDVGEVGLPHLVRPGGLGVERIGGLDHHMGRTGVQFMGLEQAVNRGFGHKVLAFIGKSHRQFAR